ncbi:MAG: endonuclease III [Actinomycetaceae bacterium]|nr:endonuclease III [Actinomycetaceae bacterium]
MDHIYYALVLPFNARASALDAACRLREAYPQARPRLDFTSAFELIVATVLSAQTTDDRVNTITPLIFSRWPTAGSLAEASQVEVEAIVRPLGFQKRRSAQLIDLCRALVERHGGEVPSGARDLEALPGVGRKTGNVVRGNWFGDSAFTVDTHVGRLSRRLGWSQSQNPARVEKDVESLLEGVNLTQLSHELIFHGRAVCTARAPRCGECVLADLCPRVGVE